MKIALKERGFLPEVVKQKKVKKIHIERIPPAEGEYDMGNVHVFLTMVERFHSGENRWFTADEFRALNR